MVDIPLMLPNAPGARPHQSLSDEELDARIKALEQGQQPVAKGPGLPAQQRPYKDLTDAELEARIKGHEGTATQRRDVGQQFVAGLKEAGAYGMGAVPSLIDYGARVGGALNLLDPRSVQSITAGLKPREGEAWRKSLLSPEERLPPEGWMADIARTGGRNVPVAAASSLVGPEGPAAMMARTAGSTIGEVAGRKAAQKFAPELEPWAGLAGAVGGWKLGGGFPAPKNVAPFVKTAEEAGLPVSAARQSGSKFAAMLEGGPRGDWDQQVSRSLLSKAGVPVGPGETVDQAIARFGTNTQAARRQLEQNSWFPANDRGLATAHQQALVDASNRGASPEQIKEINDEFANLQAGSITGRRGQNVIRGDLYFATRNKWQESANPYLNKMSDALDQAMERQPQFGAQWKKNNDDFGNFKGLTAGVGSTSPDMLRTGKLNIGAVADNIRRDTDVKDLAKAGVALSPYPQPLIDLPTVAGTGLGVAAAKHGLGPWEVGGSFVAPHIIKGPMEAASGAAFGNPVVQGWMKGQGPPMSYGQAVLGNIPAVGRALDPPPRLLLPPPPPDASQ